VEATCHAAALQVERADSPAQSKSSGFKRDLQKSLARGLVLHEETRMKIKGIVWLGTRTDRFEQMTDFCRNVLGMSQTFIEPGFAIFDLPDGDRLEVFGADRSMNEFMTHPVAGFLVDDIEAARAELEARGIEFIGPIHSDTDDYKWTHFRAPDGFVYELTYSTMHPSIAE
jgi:hypothetical protein